MKIIWDREVVTVRALEARVYIFPDPIVKGNEAHGRTDPPHASCLLQNGYAAMMNATVIASSRADAKITTIVAMVLNVDCVGA